MKLWIDSVTDRTQSDVNYVNSLIDKGFNNFTNEEKTKWLNGLKGAINESDLNRIQNNISILSDVLELDLDVVEVADLPHSNIFENIVTNTSLIRENAPIIHSTTPQTPTNPLNTFSKWNDIEQILFDVYEILHNNFYHYTGEQLYSGDEIGLLL